MNLLFSPLVFAADLILLLGGEVVLDIEGLTDFLGRFALDHVGDGLATDVKQGLNVEVVGSLGWLVWRQTEAAWNYLRG